MLRGLLKNIDPSLEEAARDMGASRWKVFTSVTLPLMLPGLGGDTSQILRDIAVRWGNCVLVSLMRQYTPFDMGEYPELDRTITAEEYETACVEFRELGLGGFFQQDESISESFIPAFDGSGLEETEQ